MNLTETCIQLLALAVAGQQEAEQANGQQQPQQQQQEQRGASPCAHGQERASVEDVALLLHQALQLAQKVSGPKGKLGPAELEMATRVRGSFDRVATHMTA